MPRHPRVVMEYRSYDLPPHLPIMILTGDHWRISDTPSGVLHFHNCLEIGLCHTDSGYLGFQDEEIPFKAGDTTLISGDMPHTTCSSPGHASRWSYIYVDVSGLMHPLLPLESIPNNDKLQELMYNTHLIFRAGEHDQLRSILESILDELIHKRTGYESCVRGLMLAFLVQLTRTDDAAASDHTDAMPIAPAIKHINEHYMEDFSISELAALCHLSPSHFRRIFREIMGTGPLEHLNRTRILKACSLLRMSDASVMAICSAVGFTSLSSFNRHFSATIGTSPTEWRRSMNALQPVTVHKYAGWLVPPKE